MPFTGSSATQLQIIGNVALAMLLGGLLDLSAS
jgi:hypothetical protein